MKQNSEYVILVDENDHPTGSEEKLKAHQDGLCHRAFSVFVFYMAEKEIEILLQQRQFGKYHSGGLWTNACCSHPKPDEDTILAGERRLFEELGIQIKLKDVGGFHYIAKFENGLTENEMDHVLIGFSQNKTVDINPQEVNAVVWMPISELLQDLIDHPKKYTAWFAPALEIALMNLQEVK